METNIHCNMLPSFGCVEGVLKDRDLGCCEENGMDVLVYTHENNEITSYEGYT